jgi:CheY-like chemotaxis protein
LSDKWILIVDDEAGILAVLKSSLRKLGDDFKVVTALNGAEALAQLKQRVFDLVITDYRMPGMDGLELLEKIQAECPGTRIILMTAYGNTAIEAEASRLRAYRYLSKPLEIPAFREIVKEAVSPTPADNDGILVHTKDDHEEIRQILLKLQASVDASCIFLTDSEGRYLAYTGKIENFPISKIGSLLGGSIATLIEAGRALDGKENSACMTYREGKSANLFVVSVGLQFLLIILIDRNLFRGDMGAVWYSAQLAVSRLRNKFDDTQVVGPVALEENLEQAVYGELDKIFGEKDSKKENSKAENP